jgi:2-desacetyl-2-hydroxyethyl bacteriochlorophyllide A dehydrogenase
MKARSIVITGKNQAAVQDFDLPEPGKGQLLIENKYSCVSPGTETRCFAGLQSSNYPFISGYMATGTVIKKGPDTATPEGTHVFISGTQESSIQRMWGGHTSHAIVSEQSIVTVPEHISLKEVAPLKLAAIAFHGFRLARPLAGERVAVIGLGALGQISARLYTMCGARTVCCDLSEFRVNTAKKAGLDALLVRGTLQETLKSSFPEGVDIIVDVTGFPAVMTQAVTLAHDIPWDNSRVDSARYIIQGSYPNEFQVNYNDAFMKELQFIVPRDEKRDDRNAVVGLLSCGKISLSDLITDIRTPRDAQKTYEELTDRQSPLLTVAFDWSER